MEKKEIGKNLETNLIYRWMEERKDPKMTLKDARRKGRSTRIQGLALAWDQCQVHSSIV